MKISDLSLIIFVIGWQSWQFLELYQPSRFKISWFISDFVISWNDNCLSAFWLLIAINSGLVFILLNYPLNRVSSLVLSLVTVKKGVLVTRNIYLWNNTGEKSKKVPAISSFFFSTESSSTSVILLKLEFLSEKRALIDFKNDLL